MSRLSGTLIIGATLATLSLIGTTAVAQGQSSDRAASNQDTRRPATLPTATEDPNGQVAQRKALYQSELDTTLARHRALGALDAIATQPAVATQPAARTDPAAPEPGVDVLASLLVGLVGGMLGGAAVMVGWTATTRRRRPRAAAGT